ncbi:glycosyltransferase family 2 protein [Aquitalea sp.]|uniref:glycosyltransferase family 2 protein n=1 Tax=Aquitalea sp. TaxID=1872623 RepID=UPI002582DAF8|nr:glycosyltransferase family 2 protein [Aquitalea sp.]
MTPLSIYVLTFNSEQYLQAILHAVADLADDLLVVDSGSQDRTVEIAQQCGARVVYRKFDDFRQQRDFAQQQCRHDHVFFLDSDEIPSPELVAHIQQLKQKGFQHDAYAIQRDWIVMGKQVHALYPVGCPDYPVRIIEKNRVCLSEQAVHEDFVGYRSRGRIALPIKHQTFHSMAEINRKLDLYTNLDASDLARMHTRKNFALRQWTSPVGAFFKWYVKSGNWKDGRVGLILGLYAARFAHRKYKKALQLLRTAPGS